MLTALAADDNALVDVALAHRPVGSGPDGWDGYERSSLTPFVITLTEYVRRQGPDQLTLVLSHDLEAIDAKMLIRIDGYENGALRA